VTFFVGLRRGTEIMFTLAGNAVGSLLVVVVRVLLLTGIMFVGIVLDVLRLDVDVLGFATVEDDAEGSVDAVGRVARVAVRGGMGERSQLHVCVCPCLVVRATN